MLTFQDIHDAIQNGYESDLPDKVLMALRPFDGKPITTRLLKALPNVPGGWRLRREYGMTHLETWEYGQSRGSSRKEYSLSLLLCHTESSIPLDLRQVEERNTAYFSARKSRNHARMEAMNTKATLEAAAMALNRLTRAYAELKAADTAWSELACYGSTLDPDKYDLERLAGVRDAKGERLKIW